MIQRFRKILTLVMMGMVSHAFLYGQERGCNFGKITGIALPSAMITYGFLSLGNKGIREIDFRARHSLEHHHRFWHTQVDNYVQFAPAITAYTLKLRRIESTHNMFDMTVIYGLSNLVSGGITYKLKVTAERQRPDNSAHNSFPSGHTETSFVAAEFLHQEYKNQSVWISIGGYSAAAFVGIARIYNNRHWVSDVVAGAGIGVLTTKVVYWTYPCVRKVFGKNDKHLHTFVFPEYSDENLSLNLFHTF